MNESERLEAISVLQDKLSWANQNRYPYVSQREVKTYQMIINFLKGDEMYQRSMLDKIRAEIEAEIKGCETAIDMYKENPDIVLCYKTFIQSYTKTLQIIDKYREEQEDNGFFDEIMDDESDGEVYEKIKEIIDKVKEQET